MNDMRDLLMGSDPSARLREIAKANDLQDFEASLAGLHMSIPKGYHHKDNWEHSLRVLDRAIEREGSTPDLVLRTAALFHDVGKPATRKFEGRGVVTFRNHEAVGAKQSRSILAAHGYDKPEREAIARLISLHMRAFNFDNAEWTDSAVRRLTTDAGSELGMDRLLVVFTSDLTTKHEAKRQRIERGIGRLSEAVARVRAGDERAALRPAIDGVELMELTGLRPGRELGAMMKFLNTDEGVALSRADALLALNERFGVSL